MSGDLNLDQLAMGFRESGRSIVPNVAFLGASQNVMISLCTIYYALTHSCLRPTTVATIANLIGESGEAAKQPLPRIFCPPICTPSSCPLPFLGYARSDGIICHLLSSQGRARQPAFLQGLGAGSRDAHADEQPRRRGG